MQPDSFENAFSSYLDSKSYDASEDALFSIIRSAFLAGWNAAVGIRDASDDNVVYLLRKTPHPHHQV